MRILLVIAILLLLLLAGALMLAWLALSVLRAGRVLDSVLEPLGVSSRGYMLLGRQYHGEIQGRSAEINYMPAQGIRPALLNIYVRAAPQARAAFGIKRPLLDCRDCPAIDLNAPDLDGLQAFAQDELWARDLLTEPANRAALNRLVGSPGTFGVREIYFQPDRIWLRARTSPQTAVAQIQQWLEDLRRLAEAAE